MKNKTNEEENKWRRKQLKKKTTEEENNWRRKQMKKKTTEEETNCNEKVFLFQVRKNYSYIHQPAINNNFFSSCVSIFSEKMCE